MSYSFSLLPANPEIDAALNASVKVRGIDVPSIESVRHVLLDPARHPRKKMRPQSQSWNDCNAQSGNNGEEWRDIFHLGATEQRSDAYTYACCELIDTGRVGGNNGSTIGGFVTLITKGVERFGIPPGIAFEKDFAYQRQTNTRQFVDRVRSLELKRTIVTEHAPCKPFKETVALCAYGISNHIGVDWPGRNDSAWSTLNGKRLLKKPTRRGVGGHAVEAIWAELIAGDWYLVVWNSHGDEFFYVNESTWDHWVGRQFAPFGGWLLLPDRAEERFLTYSQIRKDLIV